MPIYNKKYAYFIVPQVFIIILIATIGQSIFCIESNQNLNKTHNDLMKESYLATQANVSILYIEGTPYEMGYQHGILLKEKAIRNLKAFLSFSLNIGYTYQMLLDCWNQTKIFIPQKYMIEMKGLSDAVNIPVEEIGIGNIMVMYAHCSGISAWDTATKDGLLYHMRSLDYPLTVKDPESGQYLQDNSVLIIRNPDEGYASCDPSFAGFIGSLGGFNEQAIAIEVLSSWSHDETIKGTPMVFRQRMVLDQAKNSTQAIQIMTTNKTLGWNHIISDGKEPKGYAVETTQSHYYIGTWNDPAESTHPFYSIPNIIRRTNIFINKTLAATQRQVYNPKEKPILNTLLGNNKLGWSILPSFIPWIHYKGLSAEIIKYHGTLDLNSTMKLTRDFYQGKSNLLFDIFQLFGLYTTLNQWVACPQNGDIVVCFASKETNAFDQPIHYFNLYDLLP